MSYNKLVILLGQNYKLYLIYASFMLLFLIIYSYQAGNCVLPG